MSGRCGRGPSRSRRSALQHPQRGISADAAMHRSTACASRNAGCLGSHLVADSHGVNRAVEPASGPCPLLRPIARACAPYPPIRRDSRRGSTTDGQDVPTIATAAVPRSYHKGRASQRRWVVAMRCLRHLIRNAGLKSSRPSQPRLAGERLEDWPGGRSETDEGAKFAGAPTPRVQGKASS